MAQRIVFVPNIGEVVLAKRRGAQNLRLSITPAGKVRVGLPTWAPYSAGISFARSKADWIQEQLGKQQTYHLEIGDLIGKYHRLTYIYSPNASQTFTRVHNPHIVITSNLPLTSPSVQAKAVKACERALKAESEQLLPQRLKVLADRYGYDYQDVKIRKLTSRWGSCSNAKNIRLSYYLIQLPWMMIDYVLLHELVHTKYLHHGKDFWAAFTAALPNARQLQKDIRAYNPRIIPVKGVAQTVNVR